MLAKHGRSFTSRVYELYRVCVPIDPWKQFASGRERHSSCTGSSGGPAGVTWSTAHGETAPTVKRVSVSSSRPWSPDTQLLEDFVARLPLPHLRRLLLPLRLALLWPRCILWRHLLWNRLWLRAHSVGCTTAAGHGVVPGPVRWLCPWAPDVPVLPAQVLHVPMWAENNAWQPGF